MKKENIFNSLGFSPSTEKIYLALLEKGGKTLSEISKLTGLYRPAIYKHLPELLQTNLVSPIKKGKRILYTAESPHLLSTLAKERAVSLESALPSYMNIFLNQTKRPKFTIYQGKEGIKSVYEYIVSTAHKDERIFRYESPRDYKKIKEYYPEIYWQRAGSKGDIDKYVITNEETDVKRSKRLNRESKNIPKSYDSFDYNITQIISSNKVVFIDFDTETAILIEAPRFAEFQKKLFQLFFRKL
jgi:sugar-specific transcriptional regulator TrmB